MPASFKDHLLAQQSVPVDRIAKYRAEVDLLLERKRKAVARERTVARWLWAYLVLISTVFLLISGWKQTTFEGLWFGILACFWLLMGAVFLIKQLLNEQRLETLEQLKGLEVRLLELERLASERASSERMRSIR